MNPENRITRRNCVGRQNSIEMCGRIQNKKTCQAIAFTTVAIVWCKGAVKLTALHNNVMCMLYIKE